ncbi:SCP-like protein [Ancylostoma caninum]|uniref:SCP-like protein n=1 Tax=Ancylostoma caninum TaxID=29170 RepID=A0A368GVY3_ANCCA|nr:SCP-like protein [Ancylostoma caninum]
MFQYWDCNIEYNAYLHNCDPNVPVPPDYGKISANINLRGKCSDPKEEARKVLQKLWDEVKLKDLSAEPDYDIVTQENFGTMAFWETTGFACTYNKECSEKLLCLYNKKPPAVNQQKNLLYEVGNQCDGCTCVNYLCEQNPYVPAKDTQPPSLCANTNPSDDGMDYEMQVTAEEMVNYYRRLVGSGWAPDKSGYASPATKMIAVRYDCKTNGIGAATKAIADGCAAPYTATSGYSSSSYIDRNLTKTSIEVLREGIKKWAEESKLVDLKKGATFDGDVQSKAPNFAYMVNEAVSNVVCSVGDCTPMGFKVAVCQYNYPLTTGDTVYTAGKACSGCPTRKCDNDLGGGLCIP